jgi:hypothetical protein
MIIMPITRIAISDTRKSWEGCTSGKDMTKSLLEEQMPGIKRPKKKEERRGRREHVCRERQTDVIREKLMSFKEERKRNHVSLLPSSSVGVRHETHTDLLIDKLVCVRRPLTPFGRLLEMLEVKERKAVSSFISLSLHLSFFDREKDIP